MAVEGGGKRRKTDVATEGYCLIETKRIPCVKYSYLLFIMELTEVLKAEEAFFDQRKIYALVLRLGIPAIIAQLASVAMQYIDAAMVELPHRLPLVLLLHLRGL